MYKQNLWNSRSFGDVPMFFVKFLKRAGGVIVICAIGAILCRAMGLVFKGSTPAATTIMWAAFAGFGVVVCGIMYVFDKIDSLLRGRKDAKARQDAKPPGKITK
jgi:hypothetical protein